MAKASEPGASQRTLEKVAKQLEKVNDSLKEQLSRDDAMLDFENSSGILGKIARSQLKKAEKDNPNNKPYLKLFNPCGAATWLISEIDEDGDTMFGLCDLGMGHPELGYVSLKELQDLKLPLGLKIERDAWFTPDQTLNEYAETAYKNQRIVA